MQHIAIRICFILISRVLLLVSARNPRPDNSPPLQPFDGRSIHYGRSIPHPPLEKTRSTPIFPMPQSLPRAVPLIVVFAFLMYRC